MCWYHSNKNGVYFFKKKKDLEEDLSYKIVQRNKRKVEGQFKYKMTFAIASKMGKDGLNDHSF